MYNWFEAFHLSLRPSPTKTWKKKSYLTNGICNDNRKKKNPRFPACRGLKKKTTPRDEVWGSQVTGYNNELGIAADEEEDDADMGKLRALLSRAASLRPFKKNPGNYAP